MISIRTPGRVLARSETQAMLLAVAVSIAYFLAAQLSLSFRTAAETAAFWPGTGIAVGASIVFGRDTRLTLSSAIAVASIAASLVIGRSPGLAIALGVASAGQTLLTGWLVECLFDGPFAFL